MACGPFFSRARAIGVNLDAGAVQADALDADADQAMLLQGLEHAVQHARRRPPAQPRIDRVPVAAGSARHLQPFSATNSTALMTSRLPIRTLPRCTGSNGRITSYWSSLSLIMR